MKNIFKKILVIIMILPIFINAETYEQSLEISNKYLEKTDYKNSYQKYIHIQDNKLGDLITKEEFDITRYNKNKEYKSMGYSYLWNSRPFWSKSMDGTKYISISTDYKSYSKTDSTNTQNIKPKVTEYVKNTVTVYGSGTYSEPWIFAPEYKVYIKVNNIEKGYITDKTDKTKKLSSVEYVMPAHSSPKYIYINTIGINKYIGTTCGYIINSIDAHKDISNGNGPYLLLGNVTRDIECTINFGEKPKKIKLYQDSNDCGNSTPEELYFLSESGWYQDPYGNTSITSLTSTPCKRGYTFDGYRASTNTQTACSSTEVIKENGRLNDSEILLQTLTNDQTLYPCYNANEYTVTFDSNGGIAVLPPSKIVIFDSKYGELKSPKRMGYIFDGWYTDRENGTKISSNTIVTNPSDHTLYAHWNPITYKIKYVPNSGTLGANSPTSNLKYDEPIEISYPTRAGYDFTGWTASGNNLNTSTAKFGNSKNNVSTNSISSTSTKIKANHLINLTTTNNGEITLTATWSARSDTPYVVKHWKQKLNAGTDHNTTNYELAATENLTGTTDTNASSTLKTYTGFITPSKNAPKINGDGSTEINYYYDRNEYTVTITTNNGSYGTVTKGSVKLDYGNSYTASGAKITFGNNVNVTASPTQATGYETSFDNWSSTSGTISKDITITANFKRTAIQYKVTYDCNTGTSSTAQSTHTYDVEQALTKNGCTKTGYKFSGWAESSSGSVKYTDGQKVKNLSSTKNDTVKLYAKWSKQSYTVTLEKGTGISNVSGAGNYDYDSNVSVSYSTNTGYHFVNWTGDKTTATFKMPASNVKMKANGAANTYTVKYSCNGGTNSTADSSHTYDTSSKLRKNGCEKAYNNFIGWNTKADGSGTTYANEAEVKNLTSKDKDTVTLHAQWEVADSENPTCTITVTFSGATLTTDDDSGVHSYDLTKSSTATYNFNHTLALEKTTYYGYVKDNVGKVNTCSTTISDAVVSAYTCSKSAIKYSSANCDTAAKYSSPSTGCAQGTTYSSNSCVRSNLYKRYWKTCSKTSTGTYNFITAESYGDESCSVGTDRGCSASTGEYSYIYKCETLTSYKYSGYINCYTYYCNSNEGTYSYPNCYKYDQSSCASGWTSSVSSYTCSTGSSIIDGTNYCKTN